MTDKPKADPPADPPEGTDPPEPTADEVEKKYWDKFDERINGIIDAKVATLFPKGTAKTGTARTGRTTLPDVLADLFFPQKK